MSVGADSFEAVATVPVLEGSLEALGDDCCCVDKGDGCSCESGSIQGVTVDWLDPS